MIQTAATLTAQLLPSSIRDLNTSYVHTGLTNGVYYCYLVCATDICGE